MSRAVSMFKPGDVVWIKAEVAVLERPRQYVVERVEPAVVWSTVFDVMVIKLTGLDSRWYEEELEKVSILDQIAEAAE